MWNSAFSGKSSLLDDWSSEMKRKKFHFLPFTPCTTRARALGDDNKNNNQFYIVSSMCDDLDKRQKFEKFIDFSNSHLLVIAEQVMHWKLENVRFFFIGIGRKIWKLNSSHYNRRLHWLFNLLLSLLYYMLRGVSSQNSENKEEKLRWGTQRAPITCRYSTSGDISLNSYDIHKFHTTMESISHKTTTWVSCRLTSKIRWVPWKFCQRLKPSQSSKAPTMARSCRPVEQSVKSQREWVLHDFA